MGVYNPHVPYILGQEWVPIRNENYEFNPDTTTRENGFGFTLGTSRQLNTARFYTNNMPIKFYTRHTTTVNVYPRGAEADSGPINKVVIPVNNGAITGGPGGGTYMSLQGGSTLAECLASTSDFKYVQANTNNTSNAESGRFNTYYAVNDFAQILQGKRILNVTLLYAGQVFDQTSYDGGTSGSFAPYTGKNQHFESTFVQYNNILTNGNRNYGRDISQLVVPPGPNGIFGALNEVGGTINQIQQKIGRISLGDTDPLGLSVAGSASPGPWTFTGLKRFDLRNGGSGSYIQFLYQIPVSSYDFFPLISMNTNYVALEVTYCEETRVASGTQVMQYSGTGLQSIPMVDLNMNFNPILPAGDYTVTLSWTSPGDPTFILDDLITPYPQVNALREKYSLPTMPGIQVNVPFPLNDHIGDTFTKETVSVIPQISLHASGGLAPFVEPHAYGRQIAAQVYGNVTASQNLLDSAVGSNQPFPWVRFYVRRFGETTVPLTLTGTSPTVSGSSVSITVPDFDALPEIVDGWKEVTLRFNNIPSMGAGVTPTWRWSATGELAGQRWEVLGAMAPAVSGVPLDEYTNPAPSAQQLSTATYGQPAAGATVNMTWLPGFSPPVSGATADPWTDATLLFSQDMPPVTGFTVTVTNQPLTGIALDCANYPWYIPTSMAFNQLNWTPTSGSVPVSGFGYYEIQRSDTIDTSWATIAQITPPGSFSFRDFEARVGIVSSYRIRSVNGLLFPGPWSSTVTSTLTSPGVTGTGIGVTSRSLLFTSNEVQTGARTLAYAMAFNSDTNEQFNFPEAGFTQFQFMYGRDYQVAFRPTERGGATFQRTVLVNAAAISPPTLADFTSLRNMMFDPTLSYVCVRDEDGNRWFANVAVPTGNVKMNNRELYLADLTITEVTATPSNDQYPIIILDTFQRTSVNSPGSADIGGAWATSGGAASDYQVVPGAAQLTITAANTSRELQIGNTFTGDQDTTMLFTVPAISTGADMETYLFARRFDGSNYYRMELHFKTTGLVDYDLERIGSSPTFLSLGSGSGIFSYAAGDQIGIRIQFRGNVISAKAWNETNSSEPVSWTVQGVNSDIARGGTGLRVVRDAGNTNTNPVFSINYFRTI